MRQLRLNTMANARRAMARLIRDFDRDPDADVDRFRASIYAFRGLLDYDKILNDQEIERRLTALEESLQNIMRRPA